MQLRQTSTCSEFSPWCEVPMFSKLRMFADEIAALVQAGRALSPLCPCCLVPPLTLVRLGMLAGAAQSLEPSPHAEGQMVLCCLRAEGLSPWTQAVKLASQELWL